MVRSEWGYEWIFFSNYRSNARGVAILFYNNFEYNVLRETKDTEGNILALNMQIENKNISLISIYGPNTDKPSFLKKILDIIDGFDNDNII